MTYLPKPWAKIASLLRRDIPKWDRRFLSLCRDVSTWSKDPGQGVGAVIVDRNNRVVSFGFNGLPRKVKDSRKILFNREKKLRMTIHAEENALYFAKRDVEGYTLYTYPIPPCMSCASAIIQNGIGRVVTVRNRGHNPKWAEENREARLMLRQAGVKVVEYNRDQLKG